MRCDFEATSDIAVVTEEVSYGDSGSGRRWGGGSGCCSLSASKTLGDQVIKLSVYSTRQFNRRHHCQCAIMFVVLRVVLLCVQLHGFAVRRTFDRAQFLPNFPVFAK